MWTFTPILPPGHASIEWATYVRSVDFFLMSGEPEALDTIDALAAQGYESVQVRFSDGATWVSVLEDSPENSVAIAKAVLRVDPGARRI